METHWGFVEPGGLLGEAGGFETLDNSGASGSGTSIAPTRSVETSRTAMRIEVAVNGTSSCCSTR